VRHAHVRLPRLVRHAQIRPQRADGLTDRPGRARWHGGLDHHHLTAGQHPGDGLRRRQDRAHIGLAASGQRGGNRDDVGIGGRTRSLAFSRPAATAALTAPGQTGFGERRFAPVDLVQQAGVRSTPIHVQPARGERGRRGQAHVPEPDHRHPRRGVHWLPLRR